MIEPRSLSADPRYREMGDKLVFCAPEVYPEDTDLFRRANLCGASAHIHDINKYTGEYRRLLDKHRSLPLARTEEDQRRKNILYNQILQVERQLRGLVAEGEMNRYRQVYPE